MPNVIRNMAERTREHIGSTLGPVPPDGCTRHTRRCPDARSYQVELRECCKSHIREIVCATAHVLNKMGVVWWADYGTLLGAVRNPLTTWADYPWLPQVGRDTSGPKAGIVPHDKDADFGMLAVPFHTLGRVRSELQRKGYHVLLRPGGRSMKVRLSVKNETNADFFNWFEKPGRILARPKYINADNYKGREFVKDDAFPLATVTWEGITLPAPKNAPAFCAFRYGENWMKPVAANHDGVRRG